MNAQDSENTPRRPKIGHHKPTNRARFKWRGTHCYVGPWDTKHDKPSEEAIAEFNKQWDQICQGTHRKWPSPNRRLQTTVNQMIAAYVKHLDETGAHLDADGDPTGDLRNIKHVMARLSAAYGTVLTAEFDSASLANLQGKMIKPQRKVRVGSNGGLITRSKPLAPTTVNPYINKVRAAFRWADVHGYAPEGIYHRLSAVPNVSRKDKRTSPVEERDTVPLRDLLTVIRGLEASNSQSYHRTAAMMRVQTRTGMRPNEVVQLRRKECEEVDGELYFTPGHHKMEHKGQGRVVWLKQRARDSIADFWRVGNGYVFHDNIKLTKKQRTLEVKSYRKRVAAACERYGVEPFCPHRLRHTYATHADISGMRERDVSTLLGQAHGDGKNVVNRYIHTEVRDVVKRLRKEAS